MKNSKLLKISIKIIVVMLFMISLFYQKDTKIVNAETNNTYSNIDESVDYLRSEMVNRSTSVSFTVEGTHLEEAEIINLYNSAVEHTGVAYEGDYIEGNLNSYSCSYNHITEGEALRTTVVFTFDWLSTYEMEQEINAKVSEILNNLDLWESSEYDKIKGVYDYITENVRYDLNHDHEVETDYHDNFVHSTYSAIISELTVCQGYATMTYRLLLELGIDCRYITGMGNSEYHAWNIVKIGNLYYNIDATWDRSLSVYYRYFLCTDHNFQGHVRDDEFLTTDFYAKYPMAEVPYGVSAEASGKVNANISWYLESNGTLTISGTGGIPAYSYDSAPWHPYTNAISKIVIGEGITSIGNRAFIRCNYTTSVELPSTLKSIGEYSFDNCRSVKEFNLPYGLLTIGTNAFSECTSLTKMEIPDTVVSVGSSVFSTCYNLKYVKLSSGMTSIPDSMFFNMDSLTTVVIPSGITRIEDTVFSGCDGLLTISLPKQISYIGVAAFSDCTKLQSIYVDEENPYFTSSMGVLFNKDMTKVIAYPAGKTYTSYTIPDGVTTVGYGAFGGCKYLISVNFPNSLTKIEGSAFSDCIKLDELVFPANLEYIGQQAFHSCKNLYKVSFLNPNTTFDWHVFGNCKSLRNVSLPSNLTKIEVGLFSGCETLTSIHIPQSVTMIDDSSFGHCYKLSEINIPSNVSSIGYTSFSDCYALKRVFINGTINSVDWNCFSTCSNLQFIYLKGNFSGVDSSAFKECNISTLYVDNQTLLNKISSANAISGLCTNLQTIGILDSLTTIPSYISNNFTYRFKIEFNGLDYKIYSKHSCNYTSLSSKYESCTTCHSLQDKHVHKYDVEIVSPTCTSSGYTRYFCACGYSYKTNYTSSLGHSYGEWYVYEEVTCLFDGTNRRDCIRCSSYETEKIPHPGHDYITTPGYPATCTESGLTDKITCSRCTYTVNPREIEPLGHSMVVDAYVAPTCTETGLTEGSHCTRCDYVIAQEVIEKLGHNYLVVVTEPTCESEGFTTHICNRCDDEYVDSYVDALGHNMIIDERVEPTCTETGLTEGSHCTRCDYLVSQTVIEALGHDYIDVVTNPTCENDGYTTHTCSRCDDEYVDSYVDALGHDMIIDERVEPTCTETGLTEGSHCSRCDYVIAQEVIEKLGHNYSSVVTQPTCESEGYTTHTCERCDDVVVDTYVDALGHNLVIDKGVDPTCIETGLTEGSHCTRCDYLVSQTVIEALGHDYIDVVTEATCESEGYTTHTCNRCDDEHVDSYVDALGHDMIIDEKVDPTCTETGFTEGSHCSRCDYVIAQEVIEKLGHDYSSVVTQPTCESEGYTTHTCSRCGDSVIDSYVDALGHDMIIDERVEPTCTTTGLTEGSHCSRCDYVIPQQEIPTIDHEYSEWKVIVESTCSTVGYKESKCKTCGNIGKEELPLKEHTESNWITDLEPTILDEGRKHTECIVCGKEIRVEKIPMLPADEIVEDCKIFSKSFINYMTGILLLGFVLYRKRNN